MRAIQVHGHRGARARRPENTMPGFLHAIEAGADFIELDVVATRDDVLVACHDPVLKRRICAGVASSRVVRELAFEDLRRLDCGSFRSRRFPRQTPAPGESIPTLDEVFALAARYPVGFNVELKSDPARPELFPRADRYAELVASAIRRRGVESRVIVQSFDFALLAEVRRKAPDVRMSALCGFGARDLAAIALRAGASIVGPYQRTVTRRRVESAHRAGIQVVPWTANRPRDWRRLIRAGVDGIITDDPAALIEFLDGGGAASQ